tara:strand:+ start:17149 stop:19368 length:2220 start_codon:yes stop_codon:yes gene_type:complete
MNIPTFEKDLVLIGGGHAHVQVLKMLAMQKVLAGVRTTLISDSSSVCYSGMLPGCLAKIYRAEEIKIDLRALCQWAGTRFIAGRIKGIDPISQQVIFEDKRPAYSYDTLSINIGSIPKGMDIQGVQKYAIPTRPLDRLLKQVYHFEKSKQAYNGPLNVVIAGGGAAGVELAFALHSRWIKRFKPLRITLVELRSSLLAGHHIKTKNIAEKYLEEKGIIYKTNCQFTRVDEDNLYFDNHPSISYDFLLWATGGGPSPLLNHTKLKLSKSGFILVRPTLQVLEYDNVFAAGDCCDLLAQPLPKSGVYAVRQGKILVSNIKAYLQNKTLKLYKPQVSTLALLMTGSQNAIASLRYTGTHGRWAWYLKNWIDNRWMRKFDPISLPARSMGLEDLPKKKIENSKAPMRCAGCGAKVGSTILTSILEELPIYEREEVHIGLQDTDDAALLYIPSEKYLVQTVDGFRAFTHDLNLFGRIAIVHAASDLYAMGAEPHSALIHVTIPYAAKSLMTNDMKQIMHGIAQVAQHLKITILGGHTSEGSETAISITLNGFLDNKIAFRKKGLLPGDGLILTKPLGTGVILAADMQLKAKGHWVDSLFEGMLQTNKEAARVFTKFGINSVTDVTGFGLGGHLVEMLEASNKGASIKAEGIPLYPGTEYCLAEGVRSTLAPSNQEHLNRRWDLQTEAALDIPILFDPQTSGGLLAGVPKSKIQAVIQELRNNGYGNTTLIGYVTNQMGRLTIER